MFSVDLFCWLDLWRKFSLTSFSQFHVYASVITVFNACFPVTPLGVRLVSGAYIAVGNMT
jgi:hypothetical protein